MSGEGASGVANTNRDTYRGQDHIGNPYWEGSGCALVSRSLLCSNPDVVLLPPPNTSGHKTAKRRGKQAVYPMREPQTIPGRMVIFCARRLCHSLHWNQSVYPPIWSTPAACVTHPARFFKTIHSTCSVHTAASIERRQETPILDLQGKASPLTPTTLGHSWLDTPSCTASLSTATNVVDTSWGRPLASCNVAVVPGPGRARKRLLTNARQNSVVPMNFPRLVYTGMQAADPYSSGFEHRKRFKFPRAASILRGLQSSVSSSNFSSKLIHFVP
ncbi:hypothetical protein C8R43DRAFT_1105306 [Mycena crocata]|nr:hypothetical protein C8R43DRAFT_1105306 [Mycena crocata]